MSEMSRQRVTLRVHLGGVIAYVPDGNTMWALMPNGLLSTPSHWSRTTQRNVVTARAPHMGILLSDERQIDRPNTDGIFHSVIKAWKGHEKDEEPPSVAVATFLEEGLDFSDIQGSGVARTNEVNDYVPGMATISWPHRYVDQRFLPRDRDFKFEGLASSFQMRSGELSVEGYFGEDDPFIVDFAYVRIENGRLEYSERVWHDKIANQLLWTVRLPEGQRSVTLTNTAWKFQNRTTKYTLAPIGDSSMIDITIMHAEVEVAALFFKDVYLPFNVRGLPDPDFELFYGLSSHPSRKWRVPVPSASTSVGKKAKPCTGGLYEGFK